MFLNEQQLEEVRQRYTKIGVVDYNGHQLVFRRPNRAECREYRRKVASPAEKPDAMDQLAQVAIVAIDGEQDPVRVHTHFTNVFLEEFPLFTGNEKALAIFNVLTGSVEAEAEESLGKGSRIYDATPVTSEKV